jgi:hypothetical protein
MDEKNREEKDKKSRAGHYEIHGETIAKFEFFDNGYNPYSRYLDIDKVDLILRKPEGNRIKYIEVQVKFGRLFPCTVKWESKLFDFTSWRFFRGDEFSNLMNPKLYVAYVLVNPNGYDGDIFIFKAEKFNELINSGIKVNTKNGEAFKIQIARNKFNTSQWFLWKKRNFTELDAESIIDVTRYRRNFSLR